MVSGRVGSCSLAPFSHAGWHQGLRAVRQADERDPQGCVLGLACVRRLGRDVGCRERTLPPGCNLQFFMILVLTSRVGANDHEPAQPAVGQLACKEATFAAKRPAIVQSHGRSARAHVVCSCIRRLKGSRMGTLFHFQLIPHPGACGKTRVVPHNRRPRREPAETGVAECE